LNVIVCIKAGLLLKLRTSHAVGDLAWLGWTMSRPEARHAGVI